MESSALDSRQPTWGGLTQTPAPSGGAKGVETCDPAVSHSPIGSSVALGIALGGGADELVVGVGVGFSKAKELVKDPGAAPHAPARINALRSTVSSAGLPETDLVIHASYGLNQPVFPSAVMRNSPAVGTSLHPSPPWFGPGFTKIDHPSAPTGGRAKITFTVAPGGTTLGVAVPTSRPMPLASSSATNNVAGLGLLLTTVTVHRRPPGTSGSFSTWGVGPGEGVGSGELST
jgi:hypothetical protein